MQVRNSGARSAQARVDRLTASGLFRLVSDEALAKIRVRAAAAAASGCIVCVL
jgi:hypothetical protein